MHQRHQQFSCCSCSRHCCCCVSPPPQPYQSDHILQSIAHRLLLLVPPQPPLPLFPTNVEHKHPSSHHFAKSSRNQDFDLSALLRRLQILEDSLSTVHSSSSSSLLRNAAARVIQAYFRAFLVRRSRTLGQLKRLSHIMSVLETLKDRAFDSRCADLDHVFLSARRLLLQLDSVQGRDIIVVNGKRSVGSELVRFIELLDALYIEKCKISTRPLNFIKGSRVLADEIGGKKKNTDIFSRLGNGKVDLEYIHGENSYKLKPLSSIGNGKEDGYLAKAERIVTSKDSGDFSMPLCPTSGSISSDEEEILGMVDREQESRSYRNCNKSSKTSLRLDNELQNYGRDFIFSAPLPMKMDSRAGLDDV